MNKSDLIAIVASKSKLAHSRADRAVSAVFEAISQALSRGDRVELRGFCVWKAKFHRAKDGRNPKTGEPISVPARWHPSFRAGKDLSERIIRARQNAADEATE